MVIMMFPIVPPSTTRFVVHPTQQTTTIQPQPRTLHHLIDEKHPITTIPYPMHKLVPRDPPPCESKRVEKSDTIPPATTPTPYNHPKNRITKTTAVVAVVVVVVRKNIINHRVFLIALIRRLRYLHWLAPNIKYHPGNPSLDYQH